MRIAVFALAGSAVVLEGASVKQDGIALRSGGCDIDAPVISRLAAGSPVEVRSGVAGFSVPCYRVVTKVGGEEKIGYLPGPAIEGLEDFDRARQQAAAGDSIRVTSVEVEQVRQQAAKAFGPGDSALTKASKFIDSNQPVEAMRILEPLARQRPNDPDVQLLAGFAAWKSDDVRSALDYWRASLELRPDAKLERLYQRMTRENANDRSGEKAIGVRVALRYERESLDAATAAGIVRILDHELSRAQQILGCPSHERLNAILQSPENYHGSKSAPQWSGGQYDGRIRVPYAKGQPVDGRLRQVLAHETVHACLANLGQFPTWLHEGLAQKLSGEAPDSQVQQAIHDVASQLPGLDSFTGGWTGMSPTEAQFAYTVAYMAADSLTRTYPGASIQSVLRDASQLPGITAELNRRLGLGRGNGANGGAAATKSW